NASTGGAEAEYYLSLRPAYVPRNDKLQTVRELLMIRGVSPDLLFGADEDQNGFLDTEGNATAKKSSGTLEGGWSDIITVDSWTQNVNASGDSRINIQTADEGSLSAIKGISSDIAKAIVAARNGQKRLESIADLRY